MRVARPRLSARRRRIRTTPLTLSLEAPGKPRIASQADAEVIGKPARECDAAAAAAQVVDDAGYEPAFDDVRRSTLRIPGVDDRLQVGRHAAMAPRGDALRGLRVREVDESLRSRMDRDDGRLELHDVPVLDAPDDARVHVRGHRARWAFDDQVFVRLPSDEVREPRLGAALADEGEVQEKLHLEEIGEHGRRADGGGLGVDRDRALDLALEVVGVESFVCARDGDDRRDVLCGVLVGDVCELCGSVLVG